MRTYRGERTEDGCRVFISDRLADETEAERPSRPLPPRLDLRNHSPTGFEWGYGGSGPAQLALAILADYLGWNLGRPAGDERAAQIYQRFKFKVIGSLPAERWSLTAKDIDRHLAEIERETP